MDYTALSFISALAAVTLIIATIALTIALTNRGEIIRLRTEQDRTAEAIAAYREAILGQMRLSGMSLEDTQKASEDVSHKIS